MAEHKKKIKVVNGRTLVKYDGTENWIVEGNK